ncbi:electron transport complex protein RnfA [Mesoaciditoga lauensis]|uniref:electron transport complex protein RnfA n=1 Tax=Mesoaciditoga lauensis TaxID=1495039 RepID=UPI00056D94BC|nr:RnfABCDGE type electron transport complex subunit A [Mesoaciditoga lauensis]
MEAAKLFAILFAAMLVNNFLLSRFLGLCPFFGVSKSMDTAVGMSMGVIFVMVVASIVTWFLNLLLIMWHVEFLQILIFILVIAALVQIIEIFIKKTNPALYSALGIYLPLITTNCAILGLALINVQHNYTLMETIFNSVGSSLGYSMALILFSSLRVKLDVEELPAAFDGTPAAFITAFILSMSFMAFTGMIKV